MSVKRQIKTIYDIDTLDRVCRELHYEVKRNADVRGYSGNIIARNIDLVISTHGDTYDIGFRKIEGDKYEMIADFHGGYAEKKLQEILPAYNDKKLRWSRYKITKKEVVGRKLVLHIS